MIVHDTIIKARTIATFQANEHRIAAEAFDVGELVYLSTKSLSLLKSRAKKLAPKFIGPYRVSERFPEIDNYVLVLSDELVRRGIHLRFHANLLHKHHPNDDLLFPGRESKQYYNFGAPDEQEWLVESITGHHWKERSVQFDVVWTTGEHTWEPYPIAELLSCLDEYFALQNVTG